MQIYTRKSETVYFATLHPRCKSTRGHARGSAGTALEQLLSNGPGQTRASCSNRDDYAREKTFTCTWRKIPGRKENKRSFFTWLPPTIMGERAGEGEKAREIRISICFCSSLGQLVLEGQGAQLMFQRDKAQPDPSLLSINAFFNKDCALVRSPGADLYQNAY